MATRRQEASGDSGSARQAAQRELVERAKKLPGVADVAKVYRRLEPYTPATTSQAVPKLRYAAGGNAR
jgi:hypothetical protein